MRQDYLDRVAPSLLDLAVKVPLRRAGSGWEHDELPWRRWNHLQRRLEPRGGAT